MVDMACIRANPGLYKKAVRDKRMDTDIDRLLALDDALRRAVTENDALRRERNLLSRGAGTAPGAEQLRALKLRLTESEARLGALRAEFERLLLTVPSIPAPDVPAGADERDNVFVLKWGEPRKFPFEPKDHLALAEALDIADIPRAVRIAGSRSYYLKNEGVLLEQAVCRFALDHLIAGGLYAPVRSADGPGGGHAGHRLFPARPRAGLCDPRR